MNTLVLGLQWGDEAKGKVVDYLAQNFDIVVRYQGGPNAGHTVYFNGEEVVFHHIPAGIFGDDTITVIGNGCVIDIELLLEELDKVEYLGVNTTGRIFISSRANVILPYHINEDVRLEKKRSIGTTHMGVGPAYMDKIGRFGIRMGDLGNWDYVRRIVGQKTKDTRTIITKLKKYFEKIQYMIVDTVYLLRHFADTNKTILLEGAQGTMLDVDFGTYPFVTSSNPSLGGALTGTGLNHKDINKVIGVAKAYTTRVGNGPFPTEIKEGLANELRERGKEYGATTGRKRRIGWIDLFQLKYAVMLNGVDEIVLTKADVLSGLDVVKIGVGYLLDGYPLETFPVNTDTLEKVEVEYKEIEGWGGLGGAETWFSTPKPLKKFINLLQDYLGVRVSLISKGKERTELIYVD